MILYPHTIVIAEGVQTQELNFLFLNFHYNEAGIFWNLRNTKHWHFLERILRKQFNIARMGLGLYGWVIL